MAFVFIEELLPVLNVAIAPVILISGSGLLLLSMTNRFSHAIDRVRLLEHEVNPDVEDVCHKKDQLKILLHRTGILRHAIIAVTGSMLSASLLIMTLFVAALFSLSLGGAIVILFFCCLLTLMIGLALFMWDVNQSLLALRLEVSQAEGYS